MANAYYTALSGTNTPAQMLTIWESNFDAVYADIIDLETKTASITGQGVGTTGAQQIADKTALSKYIQPTVGVGNWSFDLHRFDLNATQEFIQVHTHWVDPTDSSNSLTGIIQDIKPGAQSGGGGTANDARDIYALVISGGNGIKTYVENQEVHIEGDPSQVLNASGQTFAFGSSAVKSGFDFDVTGKILNRDGLTISNLASPTASQENVFLVESNNGHSVVDLRSHTTSDSNVYFREQTTAKYVLGKTSGNDFQFYDYDKSNRVFVVDNSRSGHIAFHTGASADADATYPFWVNSNSKITGNLDVSGDITTGTFKGTLHTNTVTTASIGADQVTSAKIAGNQIDSEHYVDGSIDTVHIANDQITAAKINDDVAGPGLIPNGGALQVNPDGTHLELNGDEIRIKDNGVTTAKIANLQVTAAKIADNTITATQINANAVGASELADNAVDTAAIANNAVTSAKIATAVAGNGLAGGGGSALSVNVDDTTIEISGDQLRVKGLTSTQIGDGQITAAKLASSAVNGDKLAGTLSGNKTFSGTIAFSNFPTVGGYEIQPGAQVPIGAIIAWVPGFSGVPANMFSNSHHELPNGYWKECNGTVVNTAGSPMNGSATPDLNGEGDSNRRFLRGSNSSMGTTGGNHEHQHNVATANKGDRNGSPRWSNNATDFRNHIPPHMNVKYIIRVK